MKQLIIIGARGFGREVADFAKHCTGYEEEFLIKGFLDDDKDTLKGFDGYPRILSSVEDYLIETNDVFICSLGSIQWTEYYINIILNKEGEFINLIHKNAVLRTNVKLGYGIIIGAGSLISTDVTIGNFTQIMSYCILGHDVIVRKYCRLGDYTFIGGFSTIEDNAFLGVRSTVLARLKVGKGSTIGAGSIVIRNVKENTTVFGNPAKKIEY